MSSLILGHWDLFLSRNSWKQFSDCLWYIRICYNNNYIIHVVMAKEIIPVKGIFCDFHNIFLCMNRRYKQKKLISKISVDSNRKFLCYAWFCVFHCSHRLLCWIKSRVRDFFCENCSHFILKWFQPNSFGELCFLEESYWNMQKIQILKILRAPSIQHQWVCL